MATVSAVPHTFLQCDFGTSPLRTSPTLLPSYWVGFNQHSTVKVILYDFQAWVIKAVYLCPVCWLLKTHHVWSPSHYIRSSITLQLPCNEEAKPWREVLYKTLVNNASVRVILAHTSDMWVKQVLVTQSRPRASWSRHTNPTVCPVWIPERHNPHTWYNDFKF